MIKLSFMNSNQIENQDPMVKVFLRFVERLELAILPCFQESGNAILNGGETVHVVISNKRTNLRMVDNAFATFLDGWASCTFWWVLHNMCVPIEHKHMCVTSIFCILLGGWCPAHSQ